MQWNTSSARTGIWSKRLHFSKSIAIWNGFFRSFATKFLNLWKPFLFLGSTSTNTFGSCSWVFAVQFLSISLCSYSVTPFQYRISAMTFFLCGDLCTSQHLSHTKPQLKRTGRSQNRKILPYGLKSTNISFSYYAACFVPSASVLLCSLQMMAHLRLSHT